MFKHFIRSSMALVVISTMTILVINYRSLSDIEIGLITALGILLTWFLSEVLRRHKHELETKRLRAEKDRRHADQLKVHQAKVDTEEMLAEFKVMQELMKQLVEERSRFASRQVQNSDGAENAAGDALKGDNNQHEEGKGIVGLVELPDEKQGEGSPKDAALSREELLTIVEKALKQNRIEMLMQPIVSLPQRKPRFFECYSRIRGDEDEIYTPDHFLPLAEEKNLVRLVDNAILFRCIQMIRSAMKKNLNVSFFINVSKHTIGDDFFFESLMEFLTRNRELARHMVFEFRAEALSRDMRLFDDNLRKLKLFDCVCSVDHVIAPDLNLSKLKNFNFKYLKIDSPTFLKLDETKVKQFFKRAAMYDMDVIAAHIETEESLRELQDFNPDYGQGFLFGTPVVNKGL